MKASLRSAWRERPKVVPRQRLRGNGQHFGKGT